MLKITDGAEILIHQKGSRIRTGIEKREKGKRMQINRSIFDFQTFALFLFDPLELPATGKGGIT
jgi:hypothetical protein